MELIGQQYFSCSLRFFFSTDRCLSESESKNVTLTVRDHRNLLVSRLWRHSFSLRTPSWATFGVGVDRREEGPVGAVWVLPLRPSGATAAPESPKTSPYDRCPGRRCRCGSEAPRLLVLRRSRRRSWRRYGQQTWPLAAPDKQEI